MAKKIVDLTHVLLMDPPDLIRLQLLLQGSISTQVLASISHKYIHPTCLVQWRESDTMFYTRARAHAHIRACTQVNQGVQEYTVFLTQPLVLTLPKEHTNKLKDTYRYIYIYTSAVAFLPSAVCQCS